MKNIAFLTIVLVAAIVLECIETDYFSRTVISTAIFTLAFLGVILFDFFIQKRRLTKSHFILALPILSLITLTVASATLGLSLIAVWIISTMVGILSIGIVLQKYE